MGRHLSEKQFERLYKKGAAYGNRYARRKPIYGATEEERNFSYDMNYTRGYTEKVYKTGVGHGALAAGVIAIVASNVVPKLLHSNTAKQLGDDIVCVVKGKKTEEAKDINDEIFFDEDIPDKGFFTEE